MRKKAKRKSSKPVNGGFRVVIERQLVGVGEKGRTLLYQDTVTYNLKNEAESERPVFIRQVAEEAEALRRQKIVIVLRGVKGTTDNKAVEL